MSLSLNIQYITFFMLSLNVMLHHVSKLFFHNVREEPWKTMSATKLVDGGPQKKKNQTIILFPCQPHVCRCSGGFDRRLPVKLRADVLREVPLQEASGGAARERWVRPQPAACEHKAPVSNPHRAVCGSAVSGSVNNSAFSWLLLSGCAEPADEVSARDTLRPLTNGAFVLLLFKDSGESGKVWRKNCCPDRASRLKGRPRRQRWRPRERRTLRLFISRRRLHNGTMERRVEARQRPQMQLLPGPSSACLRAQKGCLCFGVHLSRATTRTLPRGKRRGTSSTSEKAQWRRRIYLKTRRTLFTSFGIKFILQFRMM